MPPYCLICNRGMPLVLFSKCQHVCACVQCLDKGIDACPYCHSQETGIYPNGNPKKFARDLKFTDQILVMTMRRQDSHTKHFWQWSVDTHP